MSDQTPYPRPWHVVVETADDYRERTYTVVDAKGNTVLTDEPYYPTAPYSPNGDQVGINTARLIVEAVNNHVAD